MSYRPSFAFVVAFGFFGFAASAHANAPVTHPWWVPPEGPLELDGQAGSEPETADSSSTEAQTSFDALDTVASDTAPADDAAPRTELPEGFVQRGDVVVPEAALLPLVDRPRAPLGKIEFEDIPGNEYPRKHTVYLNFVGGTLVNAVRDNSAENVSALARTDHPYPPFDGGEQKAVATAEAFQQDVAKYGIRVMYRERPSKIVPYTMVMIGGTWEDTAITQRASGVAPGADCEVLGQRHVVFVFANSRWDAVSIANVASQEAGHGWGLDHTENCGSVMSYCGSGDMVFSDGCDPICDTQCQGFTLCTHIQARYCGEGSEQQNEDAHLSWAFGGNEPDMMPPVVEVVEPLDGDQFAAGDTIPLRATVEDNYGGVGWKLTVERDGEVLHDEVDYEKTSVDDQGRAAINIKDAETGSWTFSITAEDHADHVVSDSVTFRVGEVSDDTGTDSWGTDAGTGSGTGSGEGLSSRSGCNCRTHAPSSPGWGSAAWLLLLLVRPSRLRSRSPGPLSPR